MARSEYPENPPTRPQPWADIVVGCVSTTAAARLAAVLRGREVDVTKVDGRNVHVPWGGAPRFLFDLFQYAVEGGYASDETAASAQAARIREIERRKR